MATIIPNGLQPGAVVLVNPDPTRGHEQRGIRPAVIISDPRISRQINIWTVILGTKSEGKKHKPFSTWTLAPASAKSGLKLDTFFMAEQVRAMSEERIMAMLGQLDAANLQIILRKFAAVHGLGPIADLLPRP